jgi:hypothetical protein
MADPIYRIGSNQRIWSGVHLFRPVIDAVSIFRVESSSGNQLFDINSLYGWVNIGPDQPQYEQDPNVSLYVVRNLDSYHAINIMNPNNGIHASSDIVAINDNIDPEKGYVDFGITSTGFNDIDYALFDAGVGFCYSIDEDFYIGSAGSTKSLFLFIGSTDTKDSIKAELDSSGNFRSVTLSSVDTTNKWGLGGVVTTSGLTLKTTQYITLTINGTPYKVAVCN